MAARARTLLVVALALGCAEPPARPDPAPDPGPERLRGHLVLGHEVRSFTACGSERELWVVDATDGELAEAYGELTHAPYERLYVEVLGRPGAAPRDGFGADFDGSLRVRALRHAARETRGCDERLDGVLFLARGNEPFWSVTVRADGLRLARPGHPPRALRAGPPRREGATRIWSAAGADAVELRLWEERCRDSMSGAWFAFRARLRLGERSADGCAREGEAGPADHSASSQAWRSSRQRTRAAPSRAAWRQRS